MKCKIRIQRRDGIVEEIHDLPIKDVSQMLRKAASILATRKGHVLLSAQPVPK